MSDRSKRMTRVLVLLILLTALVPLNQSALAAAPLPPVDMFQLPWDQGVAWMAIDGIDNGSKRPTSSSHNYSLGGAIDFAPRSNMVTGENTSNFWVAAAAAGIVIESSSCHVRIAHDGGWITEYQFLGLVQVKTGDAVARNQRLGIIADGVKYKYCSGYQEPNTPHLHFMLRPTLIGATFAGWQVKYSSFWNTTTFTRNGTTVGLYKLLMNTPLEPSTPTPTPTLEATPTLDPSQPTPTSNGSATNTPDPSQPTVTPDPSQATATPDGQATPTTDPSQATATPTPGDMATNTPDPSQATATPDGQATFTPTPSAPYVTTTASPASIGIGETSFVAVHLHNVPATGFTSAEFTCTYNPTLVQVSGIAVTNLFGDDAVTALNGPQNGTFIVAIAGTGGNKAASDGNVLNFNALALQAGETPVNCTARVSQGDNVLTPLPSFGTDLTILSAPSTPTFTPTATETPSSLACDQAEFIAHITVPPGTVFLPGTPFTKTWRLSNVGSCTWTTSYQLAFFNGEQMGAPATINFPTNIAPGQTVDISLNLVAPTVTGAYIGNWMFKNASGALFGIGPQANEPFHVDIVVADQLPTATPTAITQDWLTFTNHTYGFQFQYPPQGQLTSGSDDTFARINLPIAPGTNLGEKYLEVIPALNAAVCQSPLATQSMLETSETVVINGLTFLKQTGGDAGAGNIYQWVAYSTERNNVCVSLDFILHSHNPGMFSTPPPLFDYAAESAVFGEIVGTYAWLAQNPTATPTVPAGPVETSTPAPTSTLAPSLTPTPLPFGMLTGQVLAFKPVTVNLYNTDDTLAASMPVNTDGTFALTVAPGTYKVIASADGYLSAQASVTITGGNTTTLPTFTLPAGDIDGNNVIDQFDALTIGMSYNASVPAAADLNNDGTINVLDLEALALHYRKTGPVLWE